jgi:lipopolysaccharide transport system permease protein
VKTDEIIIRPVSRWSWDELLEVWRHRELLWTLAARDVAVRHKQAVIGAAWAILQPAAQMIIFTLLFHRFAGIRPDAPVAYPLFCLSGLLVWQLFSTGLGRASESLSGNANLITKVYFPRLLLPLSTILVAVVDFGVSFVFLLLVMALYRAPLHVSILATLPLAVLAALAATSIGLWTSGLNLLYRDVRHILPFILQLLLYATPVFYPASLVPERWRPWLMLNPLAPIVEAFRSALLGQPMALGPLALATATLLIVGITGYWFFRRLERTFADRVSAPRSRSGRWASSIRSPSVCTPPGRCAMR